jgi:hypothetical protein
MARLSLLLGCWLATAPSFADELRSSPLAEAFSAYPALWGVRLSPDGTKTSQVQVHSDGTTMATVIDIAEGTRAVVLVGEAGGAVIESCGWTNASRLLCSISTRASAERGRRPRSFKQGASALDIPPPVYDVTAMGRPVYERVIRGGGIGFMPLGFAQNRDELLYLDRQDDHMALFAVSISRRACRCRTSRERSSVMARHPRSSNTNHRPTSLTRKESTWTSSHGSPSS